MCNFVLALQCERHNMENKKEIMEKESVLNEPATADATTETTGELQPPQEDPEPGDADKKPIAINVRHEIFIEEMIRHGKRKRAYQTAYPGTKDSTARSNAYDLMQDEYISGKIREARERILHQTEENEAILAKERLQTYIGMRELLADIISGKRKFDKPYKTGDDMALKEVKANARDVLHAVNLNLKIAKELPAGKGKDVFRILLKKSNGETEVFE
jgi:hypothetical protein